MTYDFYYYFVWLVSGKNGGKYHYKYLEMIDNIFRKEEKTIEVCSGKIKEYYAGESGCYTVDINPSMNHDLEPIPKLSSCRQ